MYKILFVCTGNICRSPTAEGVARQKLLDAGIKNVEVQSAGTHSSHVGEAPDKRSAKVAAKYGYDISAQRAQKFAKQNYLDFDLILAMDNSHLQYLNANAPAATTAEIALFCEYAGLGKLEVPDPYYGGPEGFDNVLSLIEDGVDNLLLKLSPKIH